MRILVTGGAGFIGSHISDACVARGAEVLVLDDLSSGHRHNVPAKAAFEQADITDANRVEQIFGSFKPEVVCHQAAQVSVSISAREPIRDAHINVMGTLNLLESSARHSVGRFTFASTGGAIYGEVPEPLRAGLSTPPVPQSPYACSKFAVEQYLRSFKVLRGLRSNVLRYANVYGPRQDPHGEAGVVAIFCERVLAGKPVSVFAKKVEGDDGCVRDYVSVRDVVRANMRAIFGESEAELINVATGVPTSTLSLLRAIETLVGKKADLAFGPVRPGDVERSVLEPTPTGTEPIALSEGLAETVAWFREKVARSA